MVLGWLTSRNGKGRGFFFGRSVVDHDLEFEGLELIARRKRVVLPTHPYRIAWDWALIVFVLYSAVSVPMEVCFRYEKHISISMFDRFVDVFFFCDLLINFRTAFVKGDGTFEIEPTLIARKYLCTWFFFDLLATVPFDLLTGNAAGTNSLGLAKMPRMLRIFRLLKKLDMLTAARAMRMLSVVVFFLVFTHCIACFWWMVGVSMKEKGWQFQDEIVPLLLQDIDWVSQAQPSMRLAAEPTISVDLSRPGWLPSQYNATELLDMYETEVQLGKVYMTSLYWALTMVMKSPWLPPRSSGEQAYACVCVVFGAIAFAWFLGHVTTMIQSFEKSNALYRDGMTLVHNFFNERNLSSASRKAILAYTDAYFKTRVQGVEVQRIVASMPAHIRPAVLMEVHQALIESCPWLHECTYSGCAAFLEQLRPEVCLKGDCILRAGVISELFYILISGELQVSFPPDGAKNRKITQLFGSRLAAGQVDDGHKQSSRIPQGRIERCGSLIGWQPPFGAIYPLRYTMRAFRFTQLLSITRVDIASVLRKHTVDAAIFQKAVEHADKTLMPTRRGGGTRPPSSDSRCSLTINDARSASQLRMAAGPVKNAADALMADALGGSPTRVSKAERRASEADPANGKSDKEMQAEGWLPAARPKDDGGAPTAAVATAPSPTPPPAAAAAMPPSQPLPPTSPSQQGVAFAAAGDGGEADGGGESRKTQGWSDFVFGMGGGVQGGGGGGLEAWMREREQAEAELRAEVHDLREEIRSGFRMIALQLGDVKSDVKRGATFKAVEA